MFQINLNNFLRIITGAADVCNEDCLIQAEDRDRDQVTDEEERFNESKSQSGKEYSQEDIEHSFLRILGADLHHLLTVFHRSLLDALEADIRFDKLDCSIGACSDRLNRCTGKPVDHSAAGNQAQHEWSVKQRKVLRVSRQTVCQRHHDREDHGCRTDNGSTDQHRFCSRLERITCPIVLFEQMFRTTEVHSHIEIALNFGFDVGNALNQ